MLDKVFEIREDIGKLVDMLGGLEKTAETESREMNDKETREYTETKEKIVKMRDKEQRLIELHQLQDEVRDSEKAVEKVSGKQKEADSAKWESLGDFLGAVMRSTAHGHTDRRLVESRQLGLNEGVPAEGGFLVQTDHVADLLKRTYELGTLSSRVRRIPVSANANGLTINAINEDDRSTGSRWGGIQAYWLHEAGTKTRSNPTFRQMELKLKKLIGMCYATDELLQDTTALEGVISQAFSEEFAWMIDNSIFRGNGVGQPLGLTGHASTVTVTPEAGQAANTVLYENIVNMWSRAWARGRGNSVWLINQDIEPQLYTMSMAVGVGGVPVYLPAGGASGSPYGTLFGRPVVPIEHASTLGTAGDITLADLSQYLMIDKGGIQQAQSIHVAFATDESAFRFVYRCDGQPTWNLPLTPANSTNTLSPFVQLGDR